MNYLSVKVKPTGSQKQPVVISVSTRVSKKAVTRNLIKRRIRAIMQPVVKNSGKRFFIVVKPEIVKIPFRELKEELLKHVRDI